jgi:hypothetical protein
MLPLTATWVSMNRQLRGFYCRLDSCSITRLSLRLWYHYSRRYLGHVKLIAQIKAEETEDIFLRRTYGIVEILTTVRAFSPLLQTIHLPLFDQYDFHGYAILYKSNHSLPINKN